jgi:uncharacterized protein
MTPQLTQRHRLLAAVIYLAALWALYAWAIRALPSAQAHAAFWFSSGALMIILGRYVVEPYFTTPADAIVNGLALVLAIRSLADADQAALLFARWLLYYGYAVMGLAAISIFLKDSRNERMVTLARATYKLVEVGGKSQVMFSPVYWSASYSYFGTPEQLPVFVSTIALWICIVFFDVVGATIQRLARAWAAVQRNHNEELGHAIGCENPLQYTVEVASVATSRLNPRFGDLVSIETAPNVGSIGMVVNSKQLVGKTWLTVYLLTSPAGDVLKMDLRRKKFVDDHKSIFSDEHRVFTLTPGELQDTDAEKVLQNPLFAQREAFVGYVTKDSNISTVTFVMLRDRDATGREIAEGTILKTTIYEEDVLYQVINGNTREERLEAQDSHGFTVGLARKLGQYQIASRELATRKWMPRIFAPLFFGFDGAVSSQRISDIAQNAIGRLPETDLEIRLSDVGAIVTHNTAILGILGIGKSCLAFELIKKVAATGVKVICIDITNQYDTPDGLHAYLGQAMLSVDLDAAVKTTLKTSKDDTKRIKEGNPQASGNEDDYKKAIADDLEAFMQSAAIAKIYNPDLHPVSKGTAFKNTTLQDLTVAEKTRIIAERLFVYAMKQGESATAKYLLVFEEAHSLVPEWNSVANEGDKTATNGTAKVILQGRKYGLGSLTITQRTANVSKSILNQCNTVFAMRVFDDTGKGFLENYIGSDYANTLPTLDERHAIAIGRGLRLKQPVIIQLNDRSQFVGAAVANPANG